MKQKSIATAHAISVDTMPGLVRRTLGYNKHAMLCHFEIKKGAAIPLHSHDPVQIGMCLVGKLRFFGVNPGDEFEASAGDGYVIAANKPHGLSAIEDSTYVEVFCPARDDYKD